MSRPLWIEQQRALLEELPCLVALRTRREQELERDQAAALRTAEDRFAAAVEAAGRQADATRDRLARQHDAHRRALQQEHDDSARGCHTAHDRLTAQARQSYQAARETLDRSRTQERHQAEQDHQHACQRILTRAYHEANAADEEVQYLRRLAEQYGRHRREADEEHVRSCRNADVWVQSEIDQLDAELADARRDADNRHDAERAEAGQAREQAEADLQELLGQLADLRTRHLALCRFGVPGPDATQTEEPPAVKVDSPGTARRLFSRASSRLERLESLAPRARRAWYLMVLSVLLTWLVFAATAVALLSGQGGTAWVISSVLAAVCTWGLALMRNHLDRQLFRLAGRTNAARMAASALVERLQMRLATEHRETRELVNARHAEEVDRIETRRQRRREELNAWRDRQRVQAAAQRDRKMQGLDDPEVEPSRLGEQLAERLAEIERKRDADLAQANEQLDHTLERIDAEFADHTEKLDLKHLARLEEVRAQHQRELEFLGRQFADRQAQLDRSLEGELVEVAARRQAVEADLRTRRDAEIEAASERLAGGRLALAASWRDRLAYLGDQAGHLCDEVGLLFPDWSSPSWDGWRPSDRVPDVLRIGRIGLDLSRLEQELTAPSPGVPADETLLVPALVPFPDGCSLLLEADGPALADAVLHLKAMVLRVLTALPPGKARFTFLDPVALGENFAPFLHLADHDPALVSSRVWTEPRQIAEQLDVLAEHMTNVIQKYLRGQFASIAEYNALAGEVAEPYRFLVVSGFPAGFTPDAVRRLVSILTAGPRCGIFTLLCRDRSRPLPEGFDLETLRGLFNVLSWDDDASRFVWHDEALASWPLALDVPPPTERFNRVLHEIGARAREGSQVRVPFGRLVPPSESWWTADSRSEVRVPLGKSGAIHRQELCLGKGMAQHVLVAGRTGSGKSNLLHVLILNLALRYSPDEVELYLVDFKKGVEFKPYALHELPHARVIAIESEREFGLSVLQRLDAELRQRGNAFRTAGVANLEAYRSACPDRRCPRVVLIVDEFQEFFVEDDRLARDAALLLDRLVRQGRAFGIHIILGSQTLGGAYTLARSTLGQMAVRIALQCGDADARLVLGEDNPAARLLSRPGQAIYNDASGAESGNSVFQTAWLDEDQRDTYLQELRRLARQRELVPAGQVVFEGNAPAEVWSNPVLHPLLAWPGGRVAPARPRVWLGQPVAISEPATACFEWQSGNNLLVVGSGDESALGLAVTAIVGLAAQYTRPEPAAPPARVYLLNGLAVDEHGQTLLETVVPLLTRRGGPRDVSAVLDEVAGEVERRLALGEDGEPPVVLLVPGLQNLRELRKGEDEPLSLRGVPAGPARMLGQILREGPGVGVFSVVWCDSLDRLFRIDRSLVREFGLRVAFQMNPTDSVVLLESPLACKLGLYAALFYNEHVGRLDKFHPYALPDPAWLSWAVGQLVGGAPLDVTIEAVALGE